MKTAELAKAAKVTAEYLRQVHHKQGNYLGITPTKGPTGRLDWPDDAVAKVFGGAK